MHTMSETAGQARTRAGCLERPASGFITPPAGESCDEPGAHRSRMRSVEPEGREPGYLPNGRPSRHTCALAPRYRLPETTRHADRLSRAALR
ncbi:hypothetical protein AMES_8061 [Amycolatopsis mediterranei S699]|uniref:Uncharacterized protein n=3 Tax=Amycolatopsis mediterranei TaxID=33910 RepID=A0A0H3DGQ1_AMYMU|nr:hypothetical protein AMED_8188 [Amycolatopsis mediterranei U32]AEK46877.1 hypothetical protein RAM_42050 [Amycolatopsis mediterranei S699]AGT88723.1 hypothetical protein B737_8062 [Amycolatopsis mediterranei RB]KDO07865.1 hypothetical protein DV26_26620 [Amycolatopsis mediterranei]AFO81594.1 hypothetical protein AMES_8061 [Amycolatopsis mediterranei S699]